MVGLDDFFFFLSCLSHHPDLNIGSWLKAILADTAVVHFPGQLAPLMGLTMASTSLEFGEAAVWASIRDHYIVSKGTVITDVMMYWHWPAPLRIARKLSVARRAEVKIHTMTVLISFFFFR